MFTNNQPTIPPINEAYISPDIPQSAFKKKLVWGIGIFVIVLTGTIYLFTQQKQLFSRFLPQPQLQPTQNLKGFTAIPPAPDKTQVMISQIGIIPAAVRIKKGTSVVWVNTDQTVHKIFSNPHPLHNSPPTLNKTIAPSSSAIFTFNTIGTFSYHDETDPLKLHGSVIVY